MDVVDLPLGCLRAADGNPNTMDGIMRSRLRASIQRFNLVVPLVVRPSSEDAFEIIGGAQRLTVLRELCFTQVPCVIVEADDSEAKLLSQCLNRIAGEDDLGLRAELLREVLEELPQEGILALLPETSESLETLCSLGQEDIATYLQNWERAQVARLKHLQFQLTSDQLEIIEEALSLVMPVARQEQGGSPNARGTALYLLAREYLQVAKESP